MKSLLLVLLLIVFNSLDVVCQSAFKRCRLLYPVDSCFALHVPLKTNLLNQYRNIYELQQAFYPIGDFATDRLINVLYTVELDADSLIREGTPFCDGVDETMTNISSLDQLQFLTGWTSSGVFNILTPLQLSRIQLEISNDVYSLFLIPGSGIYLPSRFGWVVRDRQRQRVRLEDVNLVNITITVNNVSCIPDRQLVKSSLQDLTTMVS